MTRKTGSPMILILGETGVGKSTFIKAAGPVGKPPLIGHSIYSCTPSVGEYEVKHPTKPYSVLLIDTPGFNDSDIQNTDDALLRKIINWLGVKSKQDRSATLAGIIYLHDISGKFAQIPRLMDANKLATPPSVVIATVQSHIGIPPETISVRETDLQNKYPKFFKGDHFDGSVDSAWGLIDQVLAPGSHVPLSKVKDKLQGVLSNGVVRPKPLEERAVHFLRSLLSFGK